MSTDNHNIVLTSPKEIVHLDYNPETLPPPPSDEWIRFVCISDTHTTSFDVPDGDVLLHSGDLTNTGTVEDFKKTMGWLGGLPHKLKMFGVIAFESPISISKSRPELSQGTTTSLLTLLGTTPPTKDGIGKQESRSVTVNISYK